MVSLMDILAKVKMSIVKVQDFGAKMGKSRDINTRISVMLII